jgi:hypothetical protein
MFVLRHIAAGLALCLALAAAPAAADNSSTALKLVGLIVTAAGLYTGNADWVRVGWGFFTAGDVCGSTGATARRRRRRDVGDEDPAPLNTSLRVDRTDG